MTAEMNTGYAKAMGDTTLDDEDDNPTQVQDAAEQACVKFTHHMATGKGIRVLSGDDTGLHYQTLTAYGLWDATKVSSCIVWNTFRAQDLYRAYLLPAGTVMWGNLGNSTTSTPAPPAYPTPLTVGGSGAAPGGGFGTLALGLGDQKIPGNMYVMHTFDQYYRSPQGPDIKPDPTANFGYGRTIAGILHLISDTTNTTANVISGTTSWGEIPIANQASGGFGPSTIMENTQSKKGARVNESVANGVWMISGSGVDTRTSKPFLSNSNTGSINTYSRRWDNVTGGTTIGSELVPQGTVAGGFVPAAAGYLSANYNQLTSNNSVWISYVSQATFGSTPNGTQQPSTKPASSFQGPAIGLFDVPAFVINVALQWVYPAGANVPGPLPSNLGSVRVVHYFLNTSVPPTSTLLTGTWYVLTEDFPVETSTNSVSMPNYANGIITSIASGSGYDYSTDGFGQRFRFTSAPQLPVGYQYYATLVTVLGNPEIFAVKTTGSLPAGLTVPPYQIVVTSIDEYEQYGYERQRAGPVLVARLDNVAPGQSIKFSGTLWVAGEAFPSIASFTTSGGSSLDAKTLPSADESFFNIMRTLYDDRENPWFCKMMTDKEFACVVALFQNYADGAAPFNHFVRHVLKLHGLHSPFKNSMSASASALFTHDARAGFLDDAKRIAGHVARGIAGSMNNQYMIRSAAEQAVGVDGYPMGTQQIVTRNLTADNGDGYAGERFNNPQKGWWELLKDVGGVFKNCVDHFMGQGEGAEVVGLSSSLCIDMDDEGNASMMTSDDAEASGLFRRQNVKGTALVSSGDRSFPYVFMTPRTFQNAMRHAILSSNTLSGSEKSDMFSVLADQGFPMLVGGNPDNLISAVDYPAIKAASQPLYDAFVKYVGGQLDDRIRRHVMGRKSKATWQGLSALPGPAYIGDLQKYAQKSAQRMLTANERRLNNQLPASLRPEQLEYFNDIANGPANLIPFGHKSAYVTNEGTIARMKLPGLLGRPQLFDNMPSYPLPGGPGMSALNQKLRSSIYNFIKDRFPSARVCKHLNGNVQDDTAAIYNAYAVASRQANLSPKEAYILFYEVFQALKSYTAAKWKQVVVTQKGAAPFNQVSGSYRPPQMPANPGRGAPARQGGSGGSGGDFGERRPRKTGRFEGGAINENDEDGAGVGMTEEERLLGAGGR